MSYSLTIPATKTTADRKYRLEREGLVTAWKPYTGADIVFNVDPAGGPLLTNALYYTKRISLDEDPGTVVVVAVQISASGVVRSVDPAGEVDDKYGGDELPMGSKTPSIDEVIRYGGGISPLPVRLGGLVRTFWTKIQNPFGIAAISNNGPDNQALEMIEAEPLRGWLEIIRMVLSTFKPGRTLVGREREDGTPELVFADRDTLDSVTARGFETARTIITGGYARRTVNSLEFGDNVAMFNYDAGGKLHFLEKMGLPRFAATILGQMPPEAIYERIKDLITPTDEGAGMMEVEDLRCSDVPPIVPPTITEIAVTAATHNQIVSHPYGTPAKLYAEAWVFRDGYNQRDSRIGTNTSVPYQVKLSIPPDLEPWTGKVKFTESN